MSVTAHDIISANEYAVGWGEDTDTTLITVSIRILQEYLNDPLRYHCQQIRRNMGPSTEDRLDAILQVADLVDDEEYIDITTMLIKTEGDSLYEYNDQHCICAPHSSKNLLDEMVEKMTKHYKEIGLA